MSHVNTKQNRHETKTRNYFCFSDLILFFLLLLVILTFTPTTKRSSVFSLCLTDSLITAKPARAAAPFQQCVAMERSVMAAARLLSHGDAAAAAAILLQTALTFVLPKSASLLGNVWFHSQVSPLRRAGPLNDEYFRM